MKPLVERDLGVSRNAGPFSVGIFKSTKSNPVPFSGGLTRHVCGDEPLFGATPSCVALSPQEVRGDLRGPDRRGGDLPSGPPGAQAPQHQRLGGAWVGRLGGSHFCDIPSAGDLFFLKAFQAFQLFFFEIDSIFSEVGSIGKQCLP